MKTKKIKLVLPENVENFIYSFRGNKVMLDGDLAALYQVPVKRLKEQVKRNLDRFPEDFMIELTIDETAAFLNSRSQFATLKWGQNIKYGSYAFTEEGVAMLSGVLRSPFAVEVNIAIMRAFVKMRKLLTGNRELAAKLEAIDKQLASHHGRLEQNTTEIRAVFQAIRQLMETHRRRTRIGFNI